MGWEREGWVGFGLGFNLAPGLALLVPLLVLRHCSRNLSSCGLCDLAWDCWEVLPRPRAPIPAGRSNLQAQGIEKWHILCSSSGAPCSLPKHFLGRAEDLLKPCLMDLRLLLREEGSNFPVLELLFSKLKPFRPNSRGALGVSLGASTAQQISLRFLYRFFLQECLWLYKNVGNDAANFPSSTLHASPSCDGCICFLAEDWVCGSRQQAEPHGRLRHSWLCGAGWKQRWNCSALHSA